MTSNSHLSQPAHLTDDQLVLLYYREPLEESGFDGHLASCSACLSRFQELSRVLHSVSHDEIPEPAGDFEERMAAWVLAAARPRTLTQPERGSLLRFPRVTRFLAVGAAIAACLMLAFSFGRQLGRVEEHALSAAQTQERLLLTTLGEHLGRSRVTLVELKNRDVSAEDLKNLQAAADNLVSASRLFRAAAERAGETQIADVMDETERILLRFAAAPEADAKGALEGLRRRVESKDLLFRLQIIEAQVEKREKDITPASKSSL
ncbi:MAG: hypothetical protein JJE39_03860 [Vicinamibacteria bacterium]|nr:hypothetical protein [Vicinamibacteria bacterium]